MAVAPHELTVPGDSDALRPLRGATIVVTRSADRADQLVAPLEALGAVVLCCAATRIEARDVAALRRAACELARYDWVIFTSATSVKLMFDATEACGISVDHWAHTSIAAVGTSTASAIRERGATPTLVPDRFLAEGLLDAFAARGNLVGATMLYPAAAGARAELCEGLRALGARVDRIEAYDSVATDGDVADVVIALREGRVNAVTLTAKSAVDAWVAAMGSARDLADVVSIGPITTQAAHAAGLRVAAEAMPSTMEGLVAAVVRAVRAQRDRNQPLPSNS